MKNFLSRLLEYYNLTEDQFFDLVKKPNIDELPNISSFKEVSNAIDFIKEEISINNKILIYGDYDCDGILSTTILYLTLKNEKFTPGFYIPFRETDGYGLTKENIDRFADLGYKDIITVDNGITLVDEIGYARSKNINVIIIDHHSLDVNLPNANFIIHPNIQKISEYNISAGFLSFLFSYAFLGYVNEYLLTLGMITTISDLMPLKGINRNIVQLGLEILNKNEYPNILELIGKNSTLPITEIDISMSLVPKINAVGRLVSDKKLYDIVKYFVAFDDSIVVSKRSEWIEEINMYRRELVVELTNKLKNETFDDPAIILVTETKEGLIGLLANRLMDLYNKPVIVFVPEKEDPSILKGSIRSKNGFDVNIIQNDLKDILLSYGGHKNAGGLTLKKEDLEEFKKKFNDAARKHPFVLEDKKYIEINTSDISKENYDLYRLFSPFGYENEAPTFVIKSFPTKSFEFSKDGKHIITHLNFQSSLICFNYDKKILNKQLADLYGKFSINSFNNAITTQFIVTNFI